MIVTVFNTSPTPVVVDSEGRSIGGNEPGTADTTDPIAKPLFESKTLIRIDRPGEDVEVSPESAAAFDRTEQIVASAESLAGVDKDRLVALAESTPGAEALAEQDKDALVAGLAARGLTAADVPEPEPEPTPAPKSRTASTAPNEQKSEES